MVPETAVSRAGVIPKKPVEVNCDGNGEAKLLFVMAKSGSRIHPRSSAAALRD